MKAGTGWRRTTESRSRAPGEPIRRGIGSGRIQWRGVLQPSHHSGTRPFSLSYVEEKNILHIFWRLDIFVGGGPGNRLLRWQCGLPEDTCCGVQVTLKGGNHQPVEWSETVDGDWHPYGDVEMAWILVDNKTLRAVLNSKFIFIHTV